MSLRLIGRVKVEKPKNEYKGRVKKSERIEDKKNEEKERERESK